MTDLQKAVAGLDGHSICLCKGENIITSDHRGIMPMIELIENGTDLSGYSVADIIVGKAAAMLFVKANIACVHGKVLSKPAADFLKKNNIPFQYEILTDKIINRNGTDVCPMEKTVAELDDTEKAFKALKQKLTGLRRKHNG